MHAGEQERSQASGGEHSLKRSAAHIPLGPVQISADNPGSRSSNQFLRGELDLPPFFRPQTSHKQGPEEIAFALHS
jgi:hypothetical protein